ncbi:MAG: polysaccharide biosynthesis C-terminal domain-containing protein, partial [Clostridia bacterium]|nr:polysaccharide biosynthesis C-terminal domain-containing protein [Clostridia bacterium]
PGGGTAMLTVRQVAQVIVGAAEKSKGAKAWPISTAISQLIEQVGKVAIALPLAAIGMAKGGVIWGAAGALLGSTIGEAAALLYMMWQHRRAAKGEGTLQKESEEMLHGKTIAQRLIAVSIPITLGACIVPLAGFIDSVMLTQLMEKAGMAAEDALIRYGAYSGPVLTLINVPTALAMAMSTNLVPSIASGLARGDMDYVKRETATGLRLATVIGFPCSIGMSLLAKPLLYLCYRGSYTAPQLDVAAELLTISSLTIVLFTMVQATSGILQGAGKQRIPMYTLLIGVVLKIALNYTLVGIPGVDIHGAPWASLLCYTASMIPNLYFVCKHTGYRFHLMDVLVKPLGCSAVMGGVVFALWHFLFGDPGKLHGAWLLVGILLCVIAGVAVYAALAIFTKTIRKEDVPAKLRRFFK